MDKLLGVNCNVTTMALITELRGSHSKTLKRGQHEKHETNQSYSEYLSGYTVIKIVGLRYGLYVLEYA